MMKISRRTAGAGNRQGIILSTIHGAKGQEYDRVYIDSDIAASLSRPGATPAGESGDEANIAYVAFTRAIREIYLPVEFKEILTPVWQAAIKRYEPIQNSKISHARQSGRVRKIFSGFSGKSSSPLKTKAKAPQPQTNARLSLKRRWPASPNGG